MEYIDATIPSLAINKKINAYIDYSMEVDWYETGKPFPTILLVCISERQVEVVKRRFAVQLEYAGIEQLDYLLLIREDVSRL